MNTATVAKKHHILIGIAIMLFPLMLMIAMAFVPGFPINLQQPPVESGPDQLVKIAEYFSKLRLRPLIVSHTFTLFSLPFAIVTALYCSKMLSVRNPYLAMISGTCVLFGAVGWGALMGRAFSIQMIASVPDDQLQILLPAIQALLQPGSLIAMLALLTMLFLLGFILLGVGSFLSRSIPRASSIGLCLGPLSVLIFRENALFVFGGMLAMCIGLFPLSFKLFKDGHLGMESLMKHDLTEELS